MVSERDEILGVEVGRLEGKRVPLYCGRKRTWYRAHDVSVNGFYYLTFFSGHAPVAKGAIRRCAWPEAL